jgi:7-carboxy-7-deazaguanine synthase
VVSNHQQILEIKQLLLALDKRIPACKTLLMPEGITVDDLAASRDWLVDACKQNGFRYCQRLHIELFGNTRGT